MSGTVPVGQLGLRCFSQALRIASAAAVGALVFNQTESETLTTHPREKIYLENLFIMYQVQSKYLKSHHYESYLVETETGWVEIC